VAARSFTGCPLTAAQSEALNEAGITSVSGTSCTASDLNTCSLRTVYEKTGTYFQSGNTITVTIADHGLSTGTVIDLVFITGESTNGKYPITAIDLDTFTVTTTSNLRKGNLFTTESGSTNTFTVSLNTRPTADVTVTFSGLDDTEGLLSPTTLTFTEANWYTPQIVTVTGVSDSDPDGDIFYTLIATASSTGGYAGTETATISVVNQENDAPATPTPSTFPIVNPSSDTPGIIITSPGTLVTSGDVKAYRVVKDARELISFYPFYDPTKGTYTAWGDIGFSWDHGDALSDELWQISEYVDTRSYRTGDKVVRIEDGGRKLTLYEASADVSVPAGAFDPSLWTELCHIYVSEPVGSPDISGYEYYDPQLYLSEWGEFGETWETDLVNLDSDQWGDAKIALNYFYRAGDIVLYDTACGDHTCVYVATADMPANSELIVPGPPPADYWQKLYCVKNDKEDRCEKKVTCDRPNRELVSLSPGDNDLICVPVESRVGG